MSNNVFAGLRATLIAAFLTSASGCAYDVEYKYDIPENANDCPSGTIYRSGGANVRDRSGGANVRDRNGGDVNAFCEAQLCPGGATPGPGDPIIIWHLDDHKQVVVRKTCPAT